MNAMYAKATILLMTVSFADYASSVHAADDIATSADVAQGDSGLPKVEKDFSVIDPLRDFGADDGKSFATMIPPKFIKRIILLHDHGFDAEQKIRTDADRLFAQLVTSEVRSKPWGLDALERTVAECVVVTKKGDIFRVTVLSQLPNAKGAVTGVLLYGKGFSRRFDFRESPLQCGMHD